MRTHAFLFGATLAACAGRGKLAETTPTAPSAHAEPAAPPDAGGAVAPSDRDGPTYGELMRGEAPMNGTMAQAELRGFLGPLRSIKPSACAPVEDSAFWACWCRLVCGLRFEERSSVTTIRWPSDIVAGPGLTVEPDGHVSACWHTERDVPETRVTCPPR